MYKKKDYEKVVSMANVLISFLDGEVFRFDVQRVDRNGLVFYQGDLYIENMHWLISSRGKIYMEVDVG